MASRLTADERPPETSVQNAAAPLTTGVVPDATEAVAAGKEQR